jgi:hypothetical protein
MRFGINAAAIASMKGIDPPAIQPVGLHYRRHYWFRTDVFVEFGDPLLIETPEDSDHGPKLVSGEWVEPPHKQVNSLRDQLFQSLSELTPNAPDWTTYRAWHLLAHVQANQDIPEEIIEPSSQAAEILHSHDLDGRSITDSGISTSRNWRSLMFALPLMLISAPITIISTGPQALLARFLGDRTDEGVDARTTYHMLAAMFSPVLFWPPIAAALALSAFGVSYLLVPATIIAMISFHLSNLIFLFGYDYWVDFADSKRRRALSSSRDGAKLEELISEAKKLLNLSK